MLKEEEKTLMGTMKIKEVYDRAKKLILEIMTSNNSNFFSLEINPLGYINSRRDKKDGITYFGYEKDNEENEIDKEIDVVLNPNDENICDDKFYGKHFQISFNPKDLNYYIKDLGHGCGTFIKIIDWIEIKNNSLINIGENYIVFSIGAEDNEKELENKNSVDKNNSHEDILNIKIFSGNVKQSVITFSPSDCPFTIGRSNDCQIFIEDDMLSRIHCTIDYKNKTWIIQDGNIVNEEGDDEITKSTNGSWIYAYEDIKISDKMIFKANHNLFICYLVETTNNN